MTERKKIKDQMFQICLLASKTKAEREKLPNLLETKFIIKATEQRPRGSVHGCLFKASTTCRQPEVCLVHMTVESVKRHHVKSPFLGCFVLQLVYCSR